MESRYELSPSHSWQGGGNLFIHINSSCVTVIRAWITIKAACQAFFVFFFFFFFPNCVLLDEFHVTVICFLVSFSFSMYAFIQPLRGNSTEIRVKNAHKGPLTHPSHSSVSLLMTPRHIPKTQQTWAAKGRKCIATAAPSLHPPPAAAPVPVPCPRSLGLPDHQSTGGQSQHRLLQSLLKAF